MEWILSHTKLPLKTKGILWRFLERESTDVIRRKIKSFSTRYSYQDERSYRHFHWG